MSDVTALSGLLGGHRADRRPGEPGDRDPAQQAAAHARQALVAQYHQQARRPAAAAAAAAAAPAAAPIGSSRPAAFDTDDDDDAIWAPHEIEDARTADPRAGGLARGIGTVETDTRPQPEFTVRYRQALSPEDVYFPGAAAGSIHAAGARPGDALVVRVVLPGVTRAADIASHCVHGTHLVVATPQYRLELPLERTVVSDAEAEAAAAAAAPGAGRDPRAAWDPSAQTLTLVLPIKTEA
ncbi:hypothetical protein CXG81DRAFT_18949 [Caulochytrium protostelioides]|uniref:PIH1D1/2/3 CS-like domain-containing protein n=1 Tax=Caulochytrium protostelioides TaxID=1555241 RepID=A0A4P9X7K4_9FUNG|nr:hypothetical protein CXG81DRAFT_18949 [Caulochytrium protostelioides]|eukprot:RKP01226.1 hypothetical protein CXG81DRAFT_18949 [Caulochytrium protostelioides]